MGIKLKPFDLEAALRGEPVVTRDEKPVTQVTKFNTNSHYPIVAVIDKKLEFFTENGHYHPDGKTNSSDLFMAIEIVKKEGWINLYQSDCETLSAITSHCHKTKEEAKKNSLPNCIATIKIEWEENV